MLGNKLVVIIGATGTGKTRLSIEIAKAIGGEVVNADKMQIYDGLDITTNKVSLQDRCGIPHHLIASIPRNAGDFPVSFFRSAAKTTINCIARRGHTPIVVGGSNSLIHGLLVDNFDLSIVDPFGQLEVSYRPTPRSQCCFLWVHVNEVILNEYLKRRVDNMVDAGLVEEIEEYFDTLSVNGHVPYVGLGKAIGVPELSEYFTGRVSCSDALSMMKTNTQILARSQVTKIHRMVDVWGWHVHALDCTETILAHLTGSNKYMEDLVWKRDVSDSGLAAIQDFL